MCSIYARITELVLIEVMRRAACGEACPAPAPRPPTNSLSEKKELLRQQLLSSSKDRNGEKVEPKAKQIRNRQKNRWKLKFHHQALPQEYLDHYEQSLKTSAKKKTQEKAKDQNDVNITNEAFKLWAQRLGGVQSDGNVMVKAKEDKKKKPASLAPSKVMTYDDLPYMGEITLNNSKPRRGRKPKKADICHLIYENYGTVVPGQPPPNDKLSPSMCQQFRNSAAPARTDLQNRIITSLLERKLSQENKRRLENLTPPKFCSPDEPMPEAPLTTAGPLHSDDEPLNLCIRDLRDLKIQIQKKFGNIYTSMPEVKIEVEDDSDSVKSEQPNAISVIQRNTNVPHTASSSPDLSLQIRNVSPALSEPAQSTAAEDGKFPGYVYWPNAGVYMHPLALQTQLLYYQRLAAAGQLPLTQDRDKLMQINAHSPTDKSLDKNKNKLVLKQLSELLDPKIIPRAEDKSPESTKKRASPNSNRGPVKRKRSAIFIPPVPAKNNSSTPTTEVSICKFKFTGGSKPSLQEKKMLSVDSGGNFRYYSGTGSKATKGYDYIQKNNEERIHSIEPSPSPSISEAPKSPESKEELGKKKRKSKKTLHREKLEQTFKEKGFLIQTQQLQSAEGATYCKFRQLRKFTRYLFRSWKDYLPGELDERSQQEHVEKEGATATNSEAGGWG